MDERHARAHIRNDFSSSVFFFCFREGEAPAEPFNQAYAST
jgi:hypothetical protein